MRILVTLRWRVDAGGRISLERETLGSTASAEHRDLDLASNGRCRRGPTRTLAVRPGGRSDPNHTLAQKPRSASLASAGRRPDPARGVGCRRSALGHWELDENNRPTNRVVDKRRPSAYVSAIPQPRKHHEEQLRLVTDETAKAIATDDQQYDLIRFINGVRQAVDRWRRLPESAGRVKPETARLVSSGQLTLTLCDTGYRVLVEAPRHGDRVWLASELTSPSRAR